MPLPNEVGGKLKTQVASKFSSSLEAETAQAHLDMGLLGFILPPVSLSLFLATGREGPPPLPLSPSSLQLR